MGGILNLEENVEVYFKDPRTGRRVKGLLRVLNIEYVNPITKKRFRPLVIEIVGEEE